MDKLDIYEAVLRELECGWWAVGTPQEMMENVRAMVREALGKDTLMADRERYLRETIGYTVITRLGNDDNKLQTCMHVLPTFDDAWAELEDCDPYWKPRIGRITQVIRRFVQPQPEEQDEYPHRDSVGDGQTTE